MSETEIFEEFERLWQSYSVCCDSAKTLNSPNPQDDEFVKMAIVGFSYHDKTENWKRGHFKIATDYRDECIRLGDAAKTVKFNLLALGALLGLYASERIDDRLYHVGYALLPGFVMSKGNLIEKP